ncbi:Uncharacterised protein [Serratia liquefaciens]|nr:Uncharacterised protein [Serratia quinivorans]CAI2121771.1 Uncharacterised protein [Serratia quinivorans]CAI2488699.1 Uncharacterised protein [Serratia liquefaciens]
MKRKRIRALLALVPLLWVGMQHTAVHAHPQQIGMKAVRLYWRYPQARLRVDCRLPWGTVVSSVTLPLPSGVSAGDGSLSIGSGAPQDWVMLPTTLPGLSVRAALDSNVIVSGRQAGQQTGLRLELVRDGPVRAGWLSVPESSLWWTITNPMTHARLWKGRLQWKGRMRIDTSQKDRAQGLCT